MNPHMKYFEKQLKKLDYALYHAGRRNNEKEVRDIKTKIGAYEEAIKALGIVESINRPDSWEG